MPRVQIWDRALGTLLEDTPPFWWASDAAYRARIGPIGQRQWSHAVKYWMGADIQGAGEVL